MSLIASAGPQFFSQVTVRFAVLGVASGAAVGLVALGIVLAYRSSQVLNFASGAFGALAAFVFYDMRDTQHINWLLSLIVSLILGSFLGAGTAYTLSFLKRASLLAKLIATLGLMSLGEGICNVVWGGNGGQPSTFLPTKNISITHQIVIPEDRLILIGLVIVLAIALRIAYTRTLFGVATAAVSENRQIAAASGWSPLRVELINYSIAGVLSALAAILLAPIITLQASVLSLTVLSALAAALVGRFSSFGLTIGAALVIGVVQAELSFWQPNIASLFNVNQQSLGGLPDMVPLVVIILALVFAGRTRPARGEIFAKLPLPGDGTFRPGLLMGGVAIALLMLYTLSATWSDALTITFATALIVLSVVVVTGYAGQLSLCQVGLAGFGCWLAAYLISQENVSFLIAALIGMVGAMILGVVVALLAVRTRGINFAIITLGVASVLEDLIFLNPSTTGGFSGFVIKSPHVFGISIDPVGHPRAYGVFALVVLVLVGLIVANMRRGHTGRRLLAVRSNERAAASLGIGVLSAKLYAFAIAGAIAGLGGVVLGLHNQQVQLQNFDVFSSAQVVLYAVFGGVGWASGAVAGASSADGGLGSQIVQTIFHNIGTISYWLLIFAGVNVVIIFRSAPDGLASLNSAMLSHLRSRLGIGRRSADPAIPPPASGSAPVGEPASPGDGKRISVSPEAAHRGGAQTERPPAKLDVEGLVVRFGGLVAVDNVGFSVSPGEIVGLMGPNGAGKTTILDVITGFTPPTQGSVSLDGTVVDRWSPERRSRAGIVRSWQGVELFDEMTVRENLLVGADDHATHRFVSDLFSPGRAVVDDLMGEVIDGFGIGRYLDVRPSALPHGVARLVGIARAVVSNPRVLLLDEPAAGLDVNETAELSALLQRLAELQGIGILVVEHDVALMRAACDRLVVVDFGRLIVDGVPDEVVQHPDVIRAYLGVEHGVAEGATEDSQLLSTVAQAPGAEQ